MSRLLATRSAPFSRYDLRKKARNLCYSIFQAANVEFEPFWPSLFAGALKDVDVRSLITNIGSGVGSGPAAGGAAAAGGDAGAAEAPKEEAKKAESSSEEDDDMGFGLFD